MRVVSILIINLVIVLISTTGQGKVSSKEYIKLAKEFRELISDLSCDNSKQCDSIKMGSGGCAGYYKYSKKSVDEKKLKQILKRLRELDRLESEGMICPARIVYSPGLKCIKRKCVNMGDKKNFISPIHYGVLRNDISIIKEFLSKGVSIDELSAGLGETPLQLACNKKKVNLETIKFLLKSGANPNTRKSKKSTTALIFATTRERVDVVKLLLEHGANPNTQNHWGTPLDYAKHMKHKELIKILKQKK